MGFYNFYNNFILPNAEVARTGGVPNIIFQAINRPRVEIYSIEASGELRFSPERFGFSILGSLGLLWGMTRD